MNLSMKLKPTPLILLVLLWGLSGCNKAEEECGVGVPTHPPHPYTHRTCPTAGRMGAFRLAIPMQYRFAEVAYKGFDLFNPQTHYLNPKHPTLESELARFAIMVRRNNFKPIESGQDERDVDEFQNHQKTTTPLEKRWIWVAFEYFGQVGAPREKGLPLVEGDYKGFLSRLADYNAYDEKRYGRYTHEKQRAWGLEHYITSHPPGTGSDERQLEVFYDANTHQTLITCETTLMRVSPHTPLTSCDQYLRIIHPLTKDAVSVHVILLLQSKIDLADWREIEQGIRSLFDTFIVR